MNRRQQDYYDQIKIVVESKGGKAISDKYEKMVNKMIFQCHNGHQWDTEASSILKGMWCRYCNGNTRQQGEENFKRRVEEREGKVLGDYTGNHNKVLIQCNYGHNWEVIPHNLAEGKWCPTCGYKTHNGGANKFVGTVNERKGKILGNYINTRTRIEIQCENGHIWDPKPYYVVLGHWCPFCTGSTGENAIATYLNEKGIQYRSQSTIPVLPRKRYDFLLEYKRKTIIIEYDGEMHFKYIQYYHVTEEFFKYRQSVDRVKTLIALNNDYKVIRIDYSQLLNIKYHLDIALQTASNFYLSSHNLYDGWLIGATISSREYNEVIEGRSKPVYEEQTNSTSPNTGLYLSIIRN